MALSSKKIIVQISLYKNSSFTAQNIIDAIIKNKSLKKKQSKKKEKSSKIIQKDIDTIYITLRALTNIGYLIRKKNKYIKSKIFDNQGVILINPKGYAQVDCDYFTALVKKEDVNNAHSNDVVEIDITEFRKNKYFCKVKKIIERDREHYFAIVNRKTKGLIYYKLVDVPGDLMVCSNRFKSEPDINNFVYLQLTGKQLGGNPECEIKSVTDANAENLDIDRIILKHNLPGTYPEIKILADIESRVPDSELASRQDFTNLLTVTIDGETAKDFDDAISFIKSDKGFRLYIHIADVSAYVLSDSALDKEAFKRGTSYYLGNRVIPMLPEKLSNNLCSLKQNEKRLSLSVILNYNQQYNLTSYSFHRAYINVDKRLTYKLANQLIEKSGNDEISKMLIELDRFTDSLKASRLKNGRIDLEVTDPVLIYNNDSFENIINSKRLKSHMLIEECMLSANEIVSRALKSNNIPTLYRVHEEMSDEKMHTLESFLRKLNIYLNKNNNTGVSLQEIINNISGSAYEHVVNFIILRSMMQAYYGEEPLGHFGLGFKDYTHFTSPIRRYPDLIVHRSLKSLIDKKESNYKNKILSEIGKETSRLERIAQKAERELFKLKACRLMVNFIGQEFQGIISGVSNFGIFVTLKEKPIEGMIPLRLLNDDFYMNIESEFSVVGRKYGKKYMLGDLIKVRCIKSDHISMQIDFEIII